MEKLIIPINLKEYMSIIAHKYQSIPEGKEKDDIWLEIKKIADREYLSIIIEDLTNKESNSHKNE